MTRSPRASPGTSAIRSPYRTSAPRLGRAFKRWRAPRLTCGVRGMNYEWVRSFEGLKVESRLVHFRANERRSTSACQKLAQFFFCLHNPVHRCFAQLLVVQRKQAFEHGRILLAD